MKYFFQSMLGAMLLLSGVFAFSSCGNDESDPDSTVTIAMATVEKQPQYDAPYLFSCICICGLRCSSPVTGRG